MRTFSDVPCPERLEKIAAGRDAEIFSWNEGEVLRLYRDAGAHDRADREMMALEAVRRLLPSVPVPYGRLEWEGRPGILMQRLDGRGVFAEIQRRPWRAWSLAVLCGRVHADLNRVTAPQSLPTLRSEVRLRIEAADDVPSRLRRAALAEVNRLPDGDALCHGDFQPENVLLCSNGPAVIDWQSATRGDACGDFARTRFMMKLGALPPGAPALIRWAQSIGRGPFVRAYVAGYARRKVYDARLVRRWEFVRAVDRLTDGVPEEREPLVRAAERIRRELEGRRARA